MNKNVIIWSAYRDIYGNSDDKPEYVPESSVSKFDHYPRNEEEEDEIEAQMAHGDGFPVVVTPLGFIPLKPFNNPTKVFNFWIGETNFGITEEKAFIINEIPGVEILDIFTRYRFRIAVGNAFKFQEVRQAIEKAMGADRPIKNEEAKLTSEQRSKISQMIDLSLNDYDYWSIYVLPNNEFDIAMSKELTTEYNQKVATQLEAKNLVGGIIVDYESDLK
jgi:hypothetical protein